ncbi:hypothetical protein PLICRDRAFT_177738 [Plicaturopsis crispa FD-325 SS-3]|nr:hypothetical protein PLICRDRAFT_177738 [Plicaturopsis crispa FD-325 SS-3]
MPEEYKVAPDDSDFALRSSRPDEGAKCTPNSTLALSSASGREKAPISSLPSEILGEIFSFGRVEFSDNSLPFNVTVSHVSRYWRAVAIGMPMLWTNIYSGRDLYNAYPPGLLDAHIARSRSCLLRIETWYEAHEFFDRLIPDVHRWSILVVHDVWSTMLHDWANLSAPNLSHLEFLHVDVEVDADRLLDKSWPVFMGGLPKLSILVLSGHLLTVCTFPTPLLSLEMLHIGETSKFSSGAPCHVTVPQIKTVLGAANTLKALNLTNCPINFLPAPVVGVHRAIFLPHATTIDIEPPYELDETDFYYLLAALTVFYMPSLQQVVFRSVEYSMLDTFTQYAPPLTRFVNLRTLTLERTMLTEGLMRTFPNVDCVTLRESPTFDNDILLLSKSDELSRPLWPRLQALEIETYAPELRTTDFSTIVSPRLSGGTVPLQYLSLKSQESLLPSGESVAWLRERVWLGLTSSWP